MTPITIKPTAYRIIEEITQFTLPNPILGIFDIIIKDTWDSIIVGAYDETKIDGKRYVKSYAIKSNRGYIEVHDGDWVIKTSTGDSFVISQTTFDALFIKNSGGLG